MKVLLKKIEESARVEAVMRRSWKESQSNHQGKKVATDGSYRVKNGHVGKLPVAFAVAAAIGRVSG